jgi:hypothetical protein
MRIGNYEVRIPEGREIVNQDQSVYVAVKANAHFSILLINNDNRRAVAEVKIESDSMGNPILDAFGRLQLEGKVNSQMRFTVYASGSAEAIAVGEEVLTPAEKGLINVTFYAEKAEPLFETTRGLDYSGSRGGGMSKGIDPGMFGGTRGGTRSFGAAVVGMSGHSDQQFSGVNFDRDYPTRVEINLRLVIEREDRPTPISARRAIGNPVAPPVA